MMAKRTNKISDNPTKDRLKSMLKSGSAHKLRTASRIVKYGASGFKRNIWLSAAATLVATFTLVLLFVTVIASIVLSATADNMREKIDITIFFRPGTDITALNSMASTMRQDPNIKSVEVADSDTEYERFFEETKANGDKELLLTLDDENMKEIMLNNMQATMRVKVKDSNNLDSIKYTVSTDEEFVENLDNSKAPTYSTNDQAISTITSWANIAKNGGLILSALFLVISVLVIFNTIRMAIFSRREEIYMEKLVGADNNFIRGPFLVEAIMSGVLAGILASGIGYAVYRTLGPKLADYDIDISIVSGVLDTNWVIAVFAAIIALGAVIGFISARLAVRKYLK